MTSFLHSHTQTHTLSCRGIGHHLSACAQSSLASCQKTLQRFVFTCVCVSVPLRVHPHGDCCSSCFLRSCPPLDGRQPPLRSTLLTLGAGPLPHLSNPAAIPQRTPSSDSFTPCPLLADLPCLRCLSLKMAQHQSACRKKKTALAAVCCASVGHFLSLRLRALEVFSSITV